MQRKVSRIERHDTMWDIIGPTVLVAFFGFCTWRNGNLFSITMVVVFTIIMTYVVLIHLLALHKQARQNSKKDHALKKESKRKNPHQNQRLGRDFIRKTILIGFDGISVAQACLEFLKKQGINTPEPYDRLYAALEDPFWGKETAERIFDFMNRIAPEGSEFREIDENAWGFA